VAKSSRKGETRMTETTQATPALTVEDKPTPAPSNPAVEICSKAYARAYKAARKESPSRLNAEDQAEMAFRKAMPQLSGQENINDFIACVAYGMLIKAIEGPEGARLLYAAQVANSTVRIRRTKLENANTPPPGYSSPIVRQYYGLSD
jgi:hypothetical protein